MARPCMTWGGEVGRNTPHYTTMSLTSGDRLSGTPRDCVLRFNPPLIVSRTKEISLQAFSWNGTTTLISSTYNTIPLDEGGTTVLVTIADGNYNFLPSSPQYFPPVLAAALTAASPGSLTYTVAYSALTGLLTIAATGAFSILWATGPGDRTAYISYVLGYGVQRLAADVGPSASITSPSSANLNNGPIGLLVTLDSIFERNLYRTTNDLTATFYVPVNGGSGVISQYYNVSNRASRLKTGSLSGIGTISEVHVTIQSQTADPKFDLSTLNDWAMVLIVEEGDVNV